MRRGAMPRATKTAPAEPKAAEVEATTQDTVEERDSGPAEERVAEEVPAEAPAAVPDGVIGAPEQCPHGVDSGCPLCELDAASAPAQAVEDEPEPEAEPLGLSLPDLLSDEEWDALAAEYGDADLPLAEGEEVMGQRTDDDGDLIVVTSFGRKLAISPDGWMSVLTGTPLTIEAQAVPKPPRKSWKDPR
jgi:hypothetical protein